LTSRIGAVVIGRNEGERLQRCLASLADRTQAVVYVDSGSTDGSVENARAVAALVCELDPTRPFTAARARNAGFARLLEAAPDLELVQFVDGDCEVDSRWLERAESEISADPRLGVVCGRRRERHPEASTKNRLCDIEWNTPIGVASACGGDALMRVAAVREAGGYSPELIAGEEPDLCLRMRRLGWTISRIDAEMTLHDAAMTRFGQWWRRMVRAGHAYAEGSARHGRGPERYWVRETRSNWLWGLVVPSFGLGLVAPTGGTSLLLLLSYGVLAARIYRGSRRRGLSASDARLFALFCTVGKVPQALGQARYWVTRGIGRPSGIIEYKDAPNVTG
jgi:glycosyltransferase involved in cell wall biosynthesis